MPTFKAHSGGRAIFPQASGRSTMVCDGLGDFLFLLLSYSYLPYLRQTYHHQTSVVVITGYRYYGNILPTSPATDQMHSSLFCFYRQNYRQTRLGLGGLLPFYLPGIVGPHPRQGTFHWNLPAVPFPIPDCLGCHTCPLQATWVRGGLPGFLPQWRRRALPARPAIGLDFSHRT